MVDQVEEIVVVRLEGLGTFALPRAVLDGYRVPLRREPWASSDPTGPGGSSMGAVPVILREDFLYGATSRRRDLVVPVTSEQEGWGR